MALYHKYRPQRFADTVGQDHIKQTLMNQIRMDKVAHAYLFFGPRGVGKTTLARLLAKAVNCPKEKGSDVEPDNTSQAAIEISESRSLDVIEIDAASHTGVDHVREHIIDNAQFRPTSLPYKVFIIDEVHMLSTSAFNALLKTLEEPPAHVIFILATTELHKLPETIISRCQRFTFHKINYETLKAHIESIATQEGVVIEPGVVDRIINKSDGCVRDAISLLDQLIATGEQTITADVASLVLPTSFVEETLAFCASLIHKDISTALDQLFSYREKGLDAKQLGYDTIELLRAVMMLSLSKSEEHVGIDLSEPAKETLAELSQSISAYELVQLIDIVMKRYTEITSAPMPQLPLEMAVVEWCGASGAIPTTTHANTVPALHAKKTVTPITKTTDSSSSTATVTPITKEKTIIVTPEESQEATHDDVVMDEIADAQEDTPLVDVDDHPGICSFDDAKKYWKTCVSAIEKESPSLSFIFKMTDVLSISGSTLTLGVQYSFHQDKLLDIQCKQKLDGHLTAAAGMPLGITVIIQASTEKPSFVSSDTDVQDLAAAFGGQVVG